MIPSSQPQPTTPGSAIRVEVLPGERWYGGCIHDGVNMPFAAGFTRDLLDQLGNQVQPLLLSNRGRWIWSDKPFTFTVEAGAIAFGHAPAGIHLGQAGHDLRGAVMGAAQKHFPPSGQTPHELMLSHPQYNTWIELGYQQNQGGVIGFAERLLAQNYPGGVLMIDDTWQEDYGVWEFHAGRFADPRAMMDRIHALGFKLMLWICPFISADSAPFRELDRGGMLIRDAAGKPALRQWWNGYSALLDLTNPAAVTWLRGRLTSLQQRYGIDGFKFDAGDFCFYRNDDQTTGESGPLAQLTAWAKLGLEFPLNEYRACWQMGGQPLAQRLRDKHPTWDGEGLACCIPDMLAQGMSGYPYGCPDMIGGGDLMVFVQDRVEAELFVRYAQLSAMMPMMQFSAAPWRCLPPREAEICRQTALLHVRHQDTILALARHAARTGEPIMRHLAYVDPDGGHEQVLDQFMLGNDLLVAPVVTKGATSRTVRFPAGLWLGDDGTRVVGPCEQLVEAPLERLPWYQRI